jgi:hypothetical protein
MVGSIGISNASGKAQDGLYGPAPNQSLASSFRRDRLCRWGLITRADAPFSVKLVVGCAKKMSWKQLAIDVYVKYCLFFAIAATGLESCFSGFSHWVKGLRL